MWHGNGKWIRTKLVSLLFTDMLRIIIEGWISIWDALWRRWGFWL